MAGERAPETGGGEHTVYSTAVPRMGHISCLAHPKQGRKTAVLARKIHEGAAIPEHLLLMTNSSITTCRDVLSATALHSEKLSESRFAAAADRGSSRSLQPCKDFTVVPSAKALLLLPRGEQTPHCPLRSHPGLSWQAHGAIKAAELSLT